MDGAGAELIRLGPYLVGALAAVLAGLATVHVLLNKRDVGSSVAWVGLIWLSPVVGAVLYSLIGINRIQRRASALRATSGWHRAAPFTAAAGKEELAAVLRPDAGHLLHLAGLADQATTRRLVGGNRITPLEGGDEAYPAMLSAIEGARHSVTLATYIFDVDRAGRRFVEALADAAARGVEIRVLIDDVGARYSLPTALAVLRRRGLRVARFMPALLHWRMPYFNLRNHRKVMVVDGVLGFTGGMNIREGGWLALEPGHPLRDLHFRVEGPVVAQLQEVFAEDWAFSTREKLSGAPWFGAMEARGHTLARGVSDGPDVDFDRLRTLILGALAAARERVQVITPYFIPDPVLSSGLALCALRGVQVELLLPEKGNLALVEWASRPYWPELLAKGCRIYLSPPPFDHSKLMVVDGAWVLLGSANWDPRSLALNFEFNLECYDADFGREMGGWLDRRREASREVTLEEMMRRPLLPRLRDGIARLASPYL
jgi:cardiolipin synthase A/B